MSVLELGFLIDMQTPTVNISASVFTIGSSRQCNLPLKDQSASGIICKIKHTQVLMFLM